MPKRKRLLSGGLRLERCEGERTSDWPGVAREYEDQGRQPVLDHARAAQIRYVIEQECTTKCGCVGKPAARNDQTQKQGSKQSLLPGRDRFLAFPE